MDAIIIVNSRVGVTAKGSDPQSWLIAHNIIGKIEGQLVRSEEIKEE